MNKKTVTAVLLFWFVLVSVTGTGFAQQGDTRILIQQNGETIFLEPEGEYLNIDVTDLIERDGDNYWFVDNVSVPIVVERNNIVIDGKGFALEGKNVGNGIDLTTSNVTVKNLHITGWEVGILGVFDNNTIQNNYVTYCNYGISITASNYAIVSNYVANNDAGISLNSGSEANYLAQNLVTNNSVGLRLIGYASDASNTVEENVISYNQEGIYVWWNYEKIVQKIYRNNFIDNLQQVTTADSSPIHGKDPASTWNNGSGEGNYWSDYNGTDSNGDGIGDTPYTISDVDTDNYPFIAPVDAQVILEFSSWIVLSFFLVATLCVIVAKNRFRHSNK